MQILFVCLNHKVDCQLQWIFFLFHSFLVIANIVAAAAFDAAADVVR